MKEIENEEFAKAIIKLRTKEEILLFLQNFLSPSELENLVSRWEITKYLNNNLSYLDIQRQTGASSATISKINQNLKYNNVFKKLIDKIVKR